MPLIEDILKIKQPDIFSEFLLIVWPIRVMEAAYIEDKDKEMDKLMREVPKCRAGKC